jgi:hypothetical protein
MRIIFFVAIATTVTVFGDSANAQFRRRDQGPATTINVVCPSGTCAPNGSRFSPALNQCSAANCNKKK